MSYFDDCLLFLGMTLEQPEHIARITNINSVEEARPWVLRAYQGYLAGAAGGSITLDYRKIQTYMVKHPKEFPVAIQENEDGRIIGMILDEMEKVGLFHVREWQCIRGNHSSHVGTGCGTVFEVGASEEVTCPTCRNKNNVIPHARSNGGVLYQVTRAKPLKAIPGATMTKVDEVEEPQFVIRDPGNVISLMASIKANGLRVPLSCRKHGTGVQVVDGWRRLNAVRLLGLKEIPCLIDTMSDQQAFEVAGLNNFERLQMSPLEEARFFDMYVNQKGWGSIKECALKFAVTGETVRRRLDLLKTPEPVQGLLADGDIRLKVAQKVADYIGQARSQEESNQRKANVSRLKELVFDGHVPTDPDLPALPVSSFEKVIDILGDRDKGATTVRQAVRVFERELEEKRLADEEKTMVIEFQGRELSPFECPCGCGKRLEVNWSLKRVYALS